jgi:signal transduction histidine kinase
MKEDGGRQRQVLERSAGCRTRTGRGRIRFEFDALRLAGSRDDEGASFAAYVAHELRTPLAIQRTLLEFALADSDVDSAAWREIGEDVLDAWRQQRRLLDACLALARSEGGLGWSEAIEGRPSSPARMKGLLAFSSYARTRGEPTFSDPLAGGGYPRTGPSGVDQLDPSGSRCAPRRIGRPRLAPWHLL